MISKIHPKKIAASFAVVAVLCGNAPFAVAQSLDFEFFKTRVEPIFLKRRADHARCYGCHAASTNLLRLDPSPTGLHQGGRQFASQNDPDWQTLAEWVRGKKAGGASGP